MDVRVSDVGFPPTRCNINTQFTSAGWTPVGSRLGITSAGWDASWVQIPRLAVPVPQDLARSFRTPVGSLARAKVSAVKMIPQFFTDPSGKQWYMNPTNGQLVQIASVQTGSSPVAQFPAAGLAPSFAGTPVQQMPAQDGPFPSPLPDPATWSSAPSPAQLSVGGVP